MSWRIRGSYFEACNCDPICPCRRIDGVMGGRSTHGICMGVLSWVIEEGVVDGVDVAGLPVALALRYSDDEPRSPWTYVLYLDERGTDEQREALEASSPAGWEATPNRTSPGSGSRATWSRSGRPASPSSTCAGASACGSTITSTSGSAIATPIRGRSRA